MIESRLRFTCNNDALTDEQRRGKSFTFLEMNKLFLIPQTHT